MSWSLCRFQCCTCIAGGDGLDLSDPASLSLFIWDHDSQRSFLLRKQLAVAPISEQDDLLREQRVDLRKCEYDLIAVLRFDQQINRKSFSPQLLSKWQCKGLQDIPQQNAFEGGYILFVICRFHLLSR